MWTNEDLLNFIGSIYIYEDTQVKLSWLAEIYWLLKKEIQLKHKNRNYESQVAGDAGFRPPYPALQPHLYRNSSSNNLSFRWNVNLIMVRITAAHQCFFFFWVKIDYINSKVSNRHRLSSSTSKAVTSLLTVEAKDDLLRRGSIVDSSLPIAPTLEIKHPT